ncbi:agamous-like MADS-box protein AGL65 [Sesamum indicum]|uniref:Agamous-like MADS-box protein AGL65 n=1 Tax=Sesamum indicum TaxID=4182 RepID=A0A6I9U0I0_SESIN|nr:agamous-like MADS-box protein AGL65 [Sesamum indicum]
MGRVKLKIQRLESLSSRQVTYGKRRNGILKKAQEISVLCDIDIILLMFSPTGKPSIFRGQRSNIDEMIAKYAQLTPKERAKRRLESLETLKRNFKKVDQDVDIEEFLDASSPSVEEMQNRVMVLQSQLTEVHKRLSWWTNPDKIEDIEHLNQMENSLRESLNRMRLHKVSDGWLTECANSWRNMKQQSYVGWNKLLNGLNSSFGLIPIISFDCTSQSQNGMHFPIMASNDPDCQTQTWHPGGVREHMILPNEPHFLTSRDMECSRDMSFPSCSGFFGNVKNQDIDKAIPQKNDRQDDGITIDDYAGSSFLRLPLAEQYPFHTFGNFSFPDMIEPGRDANFQPAPIDYQINGNFELPRSVYNSLVPPAASCAISIFNDNSYPQPPNQFNA